MVPGDLSGSCVFTICSLFLLRLFICGGFVGLTEASPSPTGIHPLLLSALSTGLILVLWQS